MIDFWHSADPVAALIGAWSSALNPASVLFRVLMAMILSAVIGWERSTKRHSAGLRTFMLVCLAGTMAGLADSYLFAQGSGSFPGLSLITVMGSAVICVRSIFHSSRNQIRGLTTAVGLWAVSMLGVTLGFGFYTVSAVFFVALLCALVWFPAVEVVLKNRSNHFEVHLELTDSVYLQDFVTVIRRLGLTIDEIELNPAYAGSGLSVYSIAISVSSAMLKKYKTHREIIEALKTLDYVYHIEEMIS